MVKFKEFLYVYAIGSIVYMFIEVLWRGFTHWTMGIVGGVCFFAIFIIDEYFQHKPLLQRAFYSALFVTVMELLTGLVVNRCLNFAVWDYSGMRFNFMGQISLLYSILWYFLCIPAHVLCKLLRHRIFGVKANKNFER